MVAPQIVVIERLQGCVDRHHARSRGIEREGFDLLPRNSRLGQHRPHGADQRVHLVLMGLGGKIRVFPLALQRIFGGCCRQSAPLRPAAVEQGYADAQRAEIDSCDDGQSLALKP
jgi:hypothetical protein